MLENPGEYVPRTPLGKFRTIYDWITSRAEEWHPRDVDEFMVRIGQEGYVVLHLITMRWHEMISQAHREREGAADNSYHFIQQFMASYVPRDDEGVIEISLDGRGVGDVTLIAQCAAWLNATVFNCQTSEMLPAEQWMREIRDGT
jgi:hypothetical protein